MYNVLEVVRFPDPVLITPVKKVVEFNGYVVNLITQMIETMNRLDGVGLAANQVGIPLAIFVMKDRKDNWICINPTIKSTFGNTLSLEGCLSSPGKPAMVRRPTKLELTYQDVLGEFHEVYVTDKHLVSIISHEMDHLNGISILDYCKHKHCMCNFTKHRGGNISIEQAHGLKDLGNKLGTGDLIRK